MDHTAVFSFFDITFCLARCSLALGSPDLRLVLDKTGPGVVCILCYHFALFRRRASLPVPSYIGASCEHGSGKVIRARAL